MIKSVVLAVVRLVVGVIKGVWRGLHNLKLLLFDRSVARVVHDMDSHPGNWRIDGDEVWHQSDNIGLTDLRPVHFLHPVSWKPRLLPRWRLKNAMHRLRKKRVSESVRSL